MKMKKLSFENENEHSRFNLTKIESKTVAEILNVAARAADNCRLHPL